MPSPSHKIVVAISYPPIARFIALALRLEGHEPLLFADGEKALAYLLEHPFDVALVDGELARVDGFTICQRVRAASSPPIILVLMYAGHSQRAHARRVGANAVLYLPCGTEELLACVHEALAAGNSFTEERAQ
jgi:DNA-binding response OmpR family regulator